MGACRRSSAPCHSAKRRATQSSLSELICSYPTRPFTRDAQSLADSRLQPIDITGPVTLDFDAGRARFD
jgi:hypothetical protein